MRNSWMAVLGTALLALTPAPAAAQPPPPLSTPGDVSRIALIGTASAGGWTYQQFRNRAYPCSISGYQTFTIATRTGTPAGTAIPLWTFMHGGGTGYFRPDGQPTSTAHMTEESLARQQASLQANALNARIAASTTAVRMMAVSMCNRDIYGGFGLDDPNNPNLTPEGEPRYTNGLLATKAAVQFAVGRHPVSDLFLYGASAGSYGTYHVAYGLEGQGIRAAGLIADSGLMNTPWQQAMQDNPDCGQTEQARGIFPLRLHPDIVSGTNDPDQLVRQGRLTAPVMQVWSINDPGRCGTQPMACPMRDGTQPILGAVDCSHEPLRRAIAAQPLPRKSYSMRLCVTAAGSGRECGVHTPTTDPGAINTLAPEPADFNGKILSWVRTRLNDDND